MSKCFNGLTTVNVELTSRCNKNCWMCGRRKVERDYPELILKYGDMDFDLVTKIAEQLPPNIVVQLHNNGEALLYPRFGEAVKLFNRQIANSFWCAKIMRRVAHDMSFLTIRDLMTLTSGVRQFVNKLGSDILEESTMPDNKGKKSIQVIDNIVKKYSFRNRIRFFIDNFSKNYRPQSPELKMIEQQAKQGIQHVMVTIKKNNKVTLKEELLEVLDQITANVLGRIYGEVYASCMLNGKMSSQLISFMMPFMKGI